MKSLRPLIWCLFLLLSCRLFALSVFERQGVRISLNLILAFGSIKQRTGVDLNVLYHHQYFQVNLSPKLYYNFHNFGPEKASVEFCLETGLLLSYHFQQPLSRDDGYLSLYNATRNPFALKYTYLLYLNNIETSQTSGRVDMQFSHVILTSENDYLSFRGHDRYRTAALACYYVNGHYKTGAGFTLWTGNASAAPRKKKKQYPARFGYRDMRKVLYGELSHGVLFAAFDYVTLYDTVAHVSAGIDAEHVRHAIQNLAVHDMPFVPDSLLGPRNPHIPMVTDAGKMFLRQPDRQVKPARFYYQLALNPLPFY